jgi:hypothetical protein
MEATMRSDCGVGVPGAVADADADADAMAIPLLSAAR